MNDRSVTLDDVGELIGVFLVWGIKELADARGIPLEISHESRQQSIFTGRYVYICPLIAKRFNIMVDLLQSLKLMMIQHR